MQLYPHVARYSAKFIYFSFYKFFKKIKMVYIMKIKNGLYNENKNPSPCGMSLKSSNAPVRNPRPRGE